MSGNKRSSRSTRAGGTKLPPSFTDDVMRAIDRAPRPSPARALGSAVLERSGEDVRGALSVAWRIARHSTSMPVMVRAQALALVVLVAGSMVGGGVLGAVVAYQTVEPIVHSIASPPDQDARTRPDAVWTTRPPTPQETASPATIDASNVPDDERDEPGVDRTDDADDDEGFEHDQDDSIDDEGEGDAEDDPEGTDDEDGGDEAGEGEGESGGDAGDDAEGTDGEDAGDDAEDTDDEDAGDDAEGTDDEEN